MNSLSYINQDGAAGKVTAGLAWNSENCEHLQFDCDRSVAR